MTTDLVPAPIRGLYDVREWKHATAILRYEFPAEWQDIMDVLSAFRLRRVDILTPGGRKSPVADAIDGGFDQRGWAEKAFATKIVVDTTEIISPTHKVDCFKNGVGLEVEVVTHLPVTERPHRRRAAQLRLLQSPAEYQTRRKSV